MDKAQIAENFEIYRCIHETSSKELQIKLWIEDSIPNRISSFVELYCTLFDDLSFDYFVDNVVYDFRFGEELIQQLIILKDNMKNYDEKSGKHKFIINDPKWEEVCNQASKVIELWNKDVNARQYKSQV